ncbi:YciI family protein [Flavisolibacter nicotianae]|uniref:hypothetical protein n=1 Tax=Flavisolibacter nicotianae TaxID=2364882 RepID=UPI000EAE3F7A|nr:hypothetical protein [Flavisolibacter nicotianae]
MQPITDEFMQQMLAKTKGYSLLLLKPGPNLNREDLQSIIWEHGRSNFRLRAEGLLSIVAPVTKESDIVGIGIFNADEATVHERMKDDPAIREEIFTYEILPIMSFPGDSLP